MLIGLVGFAAVILVVNPFNLKTSASHSSPPLINNGGSNSSLISQNPSQTTGHHHGDSDAGSTGEGGYFSGHDGGSNETSSNSFGN